MSCNGLFVDTGHTAQAAVERLGRVAVFLLRAYIGTEADHATDGRDEAVALLDAFIKSILILGMLICFALSTLVTMAMNRLFCRKGR